MKRTRSLYSQVQRLAIVTATIFFLAACSQQDDVVIPVEPSYADPQLKLDEFKQKLSSATDGWQGLLTPKKGKMFTLFFTLDNAGEVSMLADADTVAAKTFSRSKYRVELTEHVNASVLFEEGSNLERIPSAVDKGYAYQYSLGDTLFLLGSQYGDVLKLVKATSAERQAYESRQLKNSMQQIAKYLSTVRYLSFQPEPGKIIQFSMNPLARSIYNTYLEQRAKFFGSDYSYSTRGILLKTSPNIGGYAPTEILWDAAKRSLYTYYNGQRMELQSSTLPAIPLHYLLGDEYSPGTVVPSPFVERMPGWSPKFQTQWLIDDNALMRQVNIALYYMLLDLHVKENTMDLYIYYVTPESEFVRGKFPYTFSKTDDGIYTFTPLAIETGTEEGDNADRVKDYLPNILGTVNKNRFHIEFYDAYAELGGLIPQYRSVDDTDIYFTGFFY
ncbi:MAG TPA: DUF4302 domain-containing protein [Chryseolinea sp.]